MHSRITTLLLLLTAVSLAPSGAWAQLVDSFYASHYSIRTITNVPGVPFSFGGVMIRTNSPSTLLIAGGCENAAAKIYQVAIQRAADGHITNFTGTPVVLANTPGGWFEGNPPWTGLSGDWDFGPGGVLFYLSPDGYLSQIKPNENAPAKQVDLTGVLTVGTVVSVPPGLPGAGRLKLMTRNHQWWHDVPFTSDGAGTYNIGAPTKSVEVDALGGVAFLGAAYVPAGTLRFTNASVVICDGTRLVTFEVDAQGDPISASARLFVSGLTDADGLALDPVTGDFIFVSNGAGVPTVSLVGNFAATPLPTVQLTHPANGAHFVAPAQFYLTAAPLAPGGTVANVRFYQNQSLIHTATTVPYETLVSGVAAGSYAYSAIVMDGIGRMATSSVVSITVTNPPANVAPSVTLTNPLNNAVYPICVTVTLQATASDADGQVKAVSFHDGNTLLGQVLNLPYRWMVGDLAGGTHALTAQVVDDLGARRTSSVVNLTIVAPPLNTLIATMNTNRECEACFTGVPGSNYVFWATTNLTSPIVWRPVETNVSPTGVIRFRDRTSTNHPASFYRAGLLP